MAGRVLIVGGGITGLTVAHECIEAGAEVEICEREQRWGGKAVSYRLDAQHEIAGVPVEHSLRNFGSVYFSLFDTMRRIPCDKGTVFDRLCPVPGIVLRGPNGVATRLTTALDSPAWRQGFDFYRAMRRFGVPRRDCVFWCRRIGHYILGKKSLRAAVAAARFDEHFQLNRRSRAFADFMLAFADIIFAAKADASAATVIELFALVMLARDINPYRLAHRINITRGPVNECFVDPWTAYLRRQGVRMHLGMPAVAIEWTGAAEQSGVGAIRFSDGSQRKADSYVLAVPPSAIATLAPKVYAGSALPQMRQEWSAGIQLILGRIPADVVERDCLTMFLASPWAIITLLEGPPLWAGVPMPPGVAGVLSATISRFDTPGIVHHKPFKHCNEREVLEEVLAQIGVSDRAAVIGMHAGSLRRLSAADFTSGAHGPFRGWEAGAPDDNNLLWATSAALCIYGPESGIRGAPVTTSLPELFLAGEYTGTAMKIPTMEKANQAGKLCAASVLGRLDLPYDRTRCIAPYTGLARRLLNV
jgi:uncharacterized protein with NAD-binding domain and iron-sulfur cluster